jgi:hypothetical protein
MTWSLLCRPPSSLGSAQGNVSMLRASACPRLFSIPTKLSVIPWSNFAADNASEGLDRTGPFVLWTSALGSLSASPSKALPVLRSGLTTDTTGHIGPVVVAVGAVVRAKHIFARKGRGPAWAPLSWSDDAAGDTMIRSEDPRLCSFAPPPYLWSLSLMLTSLISAWRTLRPFLEASPVDLAVRECRRSWF